MKSGARVRGYFNQLLLEPGEEGGPRRRADDVEIDEVTAAGVVEAMMEDPRCCRGWGCVDIEVVEDDDDTDDTTWFCRWVVSFRVNPKL